MSSASGPRSTAASSATACWSPRRRSAGFRRWAACSATGVPGHRPVSTELSLDALKLLKAYQRLDIEALAGLRMSVAVEREVETAMREFIRNALEREARSLAFLDEVRVPVPHVGVVS